MLPAHAVAKPACLPAGKFVLFQMDRARQAHGEGSPAAAGLEAALAAADFSSPQALAGLPLAERWIVSRLHQVVCCCLLVNSQSV
jgi:hypothetical protein